MTETIAGIEIPQTPAAKEATRLVREMTPPLVFHHSRRVFVFGSLLARGHGLRPDPELLYLASLFHDTGLLAPFSDVEQRFELDGADRARAFMQERGFPDSATETVWMSIALHTTPGIPARLAPEVAATSQGVLLDAVGAGLDELDQESVAEVVEAHPRGDFKVEFLRAFVDGLEYRPATVYGTVNADVLEHFVPGFRRGSMVERVLGSPWAR